jgi:L-lactate permease
MNEGSASFGVPATLAERLLRAAAFDPLGFAGLCSIFAD